MVNFLALETAVPVYCYPQPDVTEYFLSLQHLDPRRQRAIRAIFERTGVDQRYFVVDDNFFRINRTTQERNTLYMQEAVMLGETAIRQGLEKSGYRAEEIDDLIIVSCTGVSIPGLDLLLAARLNMRHDLRRTCVLGMGCYGAFPGLLRAGQAVQSVPGRKALMLSVELCSLHMQIDDTVENVVSSALFADGASMALIGDEPARSPLPMPAIIGSRTFSDYQTLEEMSFTLTDHGFRMYLSSYVPDVLRANVNRFVDDLIAPQGLTPSDVRFWGIHPGSRKIVEYIQERLNLDNTQVAASLDTLSRCGNMSSATILFVLEQILRCEDPQPGDYGVLLAFGPGLTMEGLLLRW